MQRLCLRGSRQVSMALTLSVLVLASACSGSSATKGASVTTKSKSSGTDANHGNSSTTAGGGASTTSGDAVGPTADLAVTADGVDLGATPRMVVGNGVTLYTFSSLSTSPTITVGPLANPDHYWLSPDNRYAAVEHSGDAVRKARLEIVATDTGKPVVSKQLDADTVRVAAWSPDSTAVIAGAQTGTAASEWAVYRVDGSSQPLTNDYSGLQPLRAGDTNWIKWAHGQAGSTPVGSSIGVLAIAQLMASNGNPVLLVRSYAGTANVPAPAGVFDIDKRQSVPFSGAFASVESVGTINASSCGRFSVVHLVVPAPTPSDRFATHIYDGLFDSDTAKITPIASKAQSSHCPVVSNGGSLVAFEATDGARVVDLASGKQTQVARQGFPIAWSKDDKSVVVQGNGSFIVAADGSGGKQASIPIQGYCIVGTTGTLITTGTTVFNSSGTAELLDYDIATDSARTLGKGNLGPGYSPTCQVSADAKWVVAGTNVIDVANGHSGVVQMKLNKSYVNLAIHLWSPAATSLIQRKAA